MIDKLLAAALTTIVCFCTTSCGVLNEYQGAIKSSSYLYAFGRYASGSLPRYEIIVSRQGSNQKIKKNDLDCGKGNRALEVHFVKDQIVLLLWWSVIDGSNGFSCFIAFREQANQLIKLDEPTELILISKVISALKIESPNDQPVVNLKHLIQEYATKRQLINAGEVVGYLEIK